MTISVVLPFVFKKCFLYNEKISNLEFLVSLYVSDTQYARLYE